MEVQKQGIKLSSSETLQLYEVEHNIKGKKLYSNPSILYVKKKQKPTPNQKMPKPPRGLYIFNIQFQQILIQFFL